MRNTKVEGKTKRGDDSAILLPRWYMSRSLVVRQLACFMDWKSLSTVGCLSVATHCS